MAVKRIGVIGPHYDADVRELKAKVEDRGGEATIIDLTLYPSVVKGSIGLDEVMYDGMNLLDLDAFYLRRLTPIWDLPMKDFSQEEWVDHYGRFNDYMDNQRAIHSFKLSLVSILCERKLVINPYRAWGFHHMKLHQFWILKENGFKVPAFVSGNNYFDLKRFLESRDAVEKPVVTGPVKRVDMEALESGRAGLRERPTVYQEYIEGKSIRAFVLGEDLLVACELPRKSWGVDASEQIEFMKRIELPADVQKDIINAPKSLGMIFCGVDLQYQESSGEYFILECNSGPYFRPYDTQISADIGGKLADFLMEKS
jgi:hypothetical protein